MRINRFRMRTFGRTCFLLRIMNLLCTIVLAPCFTARINPFIYGFAIVGFVELVMQYIEYNRRVDSLTDLQDILHMVRLFIVFDGDALAYVYG